MPVRSRPLVQEKTMKVRETHIRDFWAYVKFNRRVNGGFGSKTYFCPDNYSFMRGQGNTLLCFVQYESLGKMKAAPREPRLLKMALDGKKLLNWHIEQWAEGRADGTLLKDELRECIKDLPSWVEKSLYNQIKKLLR